MIMTAASSRSSVEELSMPCLISLSTFKCIIHVCFQPELSTLGSHITTNKSPPTTGLVQHGGSHVCEPLLLFILIYYLLDMKRSVR